MEELIGDLNLAFRLEQADVMPLQTEELDLCGFVRSITADIASGPKASAYELELNAPDNMVLVKGDKRLLTRMFQNLLINSIDHNLPGTRISVIVEEHSHEVAVTVRDNGRGIGPEAQELLFSRYSSERSGDSNGASRGLGLAVVKSILEDHGGWIQVESEVDRGSRFVVRLPRAQ